MKFTKFSVTVILALQWNYLQSNALLQKFSHYKGNIFTANACIVVILIMKWRKLYSIIDAIVGQDTIKILTILNKI